MNRNMMLLISTAVGGTVGYFVSAVIADYLDEKEIRDQAPLITNEDEELSTDDEDEEESSSGKTTMSKSKKYKGKSNKTDYTSYFNSINRPDLAALAQKYNEGKTGNEPHQDGIVASMIAFDEFENSEKFKSPLDDITVISQEQFNNNVDEFEVVDLTYYADGIMVGEDDNIISGPEDIIGTDALSSFGMSSDDPDIVYVRNPKTRALYEIVRMSVKYAIDAERDEIIPRKGLKRGIDFDEVTNDENDEEAAY